MRRPHRSPYAVIKACVCALVPIYAHASLAISDLRCENRVEPLGIDAARPALSWQLHSKERGQVQTGYQIIAASSLSTLSEAKSDLWSSGRVGSSESIAIPFTGKPLQSGQRVYWKVR